MGFTYSFGVCPAKNKSFRSAQLGASDSGDAVRNPFSDVGDAVMDGMNNATKSAGRAIGSAADDVVDRASEAGDFVSGTLKDTGEVLSNATDTVVTGVKEGGKTLAKTAEQVGNAVTDAIPQSVKDGFEDLAARALDALPVAEITKVPRYSPRYSPRSEIPRTQH